MRFSIGCEKVRVDKGFSIILGVLCRKGWVPFAVEEIGAVGQYEADFHGALRKVCP
jgi:hypothetical protein